MASPARLHCELTGFLRQHCPVRDQRHLVLLAWMVTGLPLSETVCFDYLQLQPRTLFQSLGGNDQGGAGSSQVLGHRAAGGVAPPLSMHPNGCQQPALAAEQDPLLGQQLIGAAARNSVGELGVDGVPAELLALMAG